jgi:hypothetical protein
MHDENGRVTLCFYDKVQLLEADERAELDQFPIGDDYYLSATGSPALFGEAGFSTIERLGARPTLEVNGLYSGFIEEGAKTVLPAWAMAKFQHVWFPISTRTKYISKCTLILNNMPLRKSGGLSHPCMVDLHQFQIGILPISRR